VTGPDGVEGWVGPLGATGPRGVTGLTGWEPSGYSVMGPMGTSLRITKYSISPVWVITYDIYAGYQYALYEYPTGIPSSSAASIVGFNGTLAYYENIIPGTVCTFTSLYLTDVAGVWNLNATIVSSAFIPSAYTNSYGDYIYPSYLSFETPFSINTYT
jgi:hypothetical protein